MLHEPTTFSCGRGAPRHARSDLRHRCFDRARASSCGSPRPAPRLQNVTRPITIPAGVVAEWWRGTHAALLESGSLEALTPELAKRAGDLLAETGGSNAVDATVVASAAQRGDLVVTGDRDDLEALARAVAGVTVEKLR